MMILYTNPEKHNIDEILILEKKTFGVNAYSRDFLLYLLTAADFFKLAKNNNQIIGYICGEVAFGYGHLISLAVAENYRNRGVGSSLLKMFIDFLRENKITTIYLEVSIENHDAIRFYLKRGFRIIDKLQHYYSDKSDAYVMELELKYP